MKKTKWSLNLHQRTIHCKILHNSTQCTANSSYNQKGHFWGLQTSEYKCCVQSKRTLLGTLNIRVVVLCTIKKGTFGDLDPTDSEQACDHLWSASSITIDILLIFDDAIISHCQTDHIQQSNDDKATSEKLRKFSNIRNLVNKNCRCPPNKWNLVSSGESTRCTYIFSVRRWQRRSTVMIVAFATNCRSPPLLGRPGERCLCSAMLCWCGNYCCYKYFCDNIIATILLLLLQIFFLL